MSNPQDPSSQGGPAGVPPIDKPYYNAPFLAAVRRFFTKYATFSGRASRAEYWWWFLVQLLVVCVWAVLESIAGGPTGDGHGPTAAYVVFNVILGVWGLVTLVPGIALAWRRLHDSDHGGPFWFLGFIPVVGGIIVLIFMLLPPQPRGARFDR
jgi:uncharacterized membrane protein YhaH (DUF805 family)